MFKNYFIVKKNCLKSLFFLLGFTSLFLASFSYGKEAAVLSKKASEIKQKRSKAKATPTTKEAKQEVSRAFHSNYLPYIEVGGVVLLVHTILN